MLFSTIPQTHPNPRRCLADAVGKGKKILIFADKYHPMANGVIPHNLVGSFVQAYISNVA